MTTFAIQNFGCRATQADASAIEAELLAGGAQRAASSDHADVVVFNTCTVTAAADAQTRDAIRHVHRANSGARIIVTGCYAQRAPEEIACLEGVTWVVGNSRQAQIPALIDDSGVATRVDMADSQPTDFVPLRALGASETRDLSRRKILLDDLSSWRGAFVQPTIPIDQDRTRPILKIQDGCNNRCSYCIIPAVRGASRSLEPQAVLTAIRDLAASGAREVVLSGINLGSYGRDLAPPTSLARLLPRILDETPIESIRLSSIEPMDVTQDFVQLLATHSRLAPHFHMPLQSGSDKVLRAMHRWYRAAHYERRIDLIREFLPNAAIGADVIAGFPRETDSDFAETMSFVERLHFTYLHVFSFSERPGTPAAGLTGIVAPEVIHRRARALRTLAAKKDAEFRAKQVGRTVRALTLRHKKTWTGASDPLGWTPALTGNFLKIRVEGNWPANRWIEIALPAGAESAKPITKPY